MLIHFIVDRFSLYSVWVHKHLRILSTIFLVGLALGTSLFFFLPQGNATSPACSPEAIAETVSHSIEKDWVIFSQQNQSFSYDNVYEPIKDYTQSLLSDFSLKSYNSMLPYYHAKQGKLFELSLLQGLQNVSSADDLIQGKNKKNTTVLWIPELTQKSKHPIIALYTEKIPNGTSINSLLPVVPTVVLGYEASVQFAVFSCAYHQDSAEIIKNNDSLQGISTELDRVNKEKASDLLKAKRILDMALSAYDSFIIAYPQHMSYERTIDKLQKLKSQFSKLEELSASCVYKNHLNASCK